MNQHGRVTCTRVRFSLTESKLFPSKFLHMSDKGHRHDGVYVLWKLLVCFVSFFFGQPTYSLHRQQSSRASMEGLRVRVCVLRSRCHCLYLFPPAVPHMPDTGHRRGDICILWTILAEISFFFFILDSLLIAYTDNKAHEPAWKGYVYACAFFVAAVTASIFFHQQFHIGMTLGMRIKSACISAVYKKVL